MHYNEPGRTDWEGWATGSLASAAGGATCVFEMPLNAFPPTLYAESFAQKRAAAEASSVLDFGLWGGITPINLDKLSELADCGVVGFKAFLSSSGTPDFERTIVFARVAHRVEMRTDDDRLCTAFGRSDASDQIESRVLAHDHSPLSHPRSDQLVRPLHRG
ncbi:MAG: hypothetical protein ACKOFH_08545 [Chthoniobacterales bacterium]